MIRVDDAPFDPELELAGFRLAHRAAGAVASFLGCVRGDGATALVLEHHPVLTRRAIDGFVQEACQRFDLLGVSVIHRYGRMAPGEPIVLVASASAHRRAALDAVDFLMDLLKMETPFWKREETAEGERWIEPRPEDYADRRRWIKE
jgi:molybdopterin synthase catalytic subunit